MAAKLPLTSLLAAKLSGNPPFMAQINGKCAQISPNEAKMGRIQGILGQNEGISREIPCSGPIFHDFFGIFHDFFERISIFHDFFGEFLKENPVQKARLGDMSYYQNLCYH